MLNALVRSWLTYACQSWSITRTQLNKLSSTYCVMLLKMIKGGYRRKQNTWSFEITNQDLLRIGNTEDISDFIARQQRNYVIRKENTSVLKRLMFNDDERHKPGRNVTLLYSAISNAHCTASQTNRIY